MTKRILTILITLSALVASAAGQSASDREAVKSALIDFFADYEYPDDDMAGLPAPSVESFSIDARRQIVTVTVSSAFAAQRFSAKSVKKIYRKLAKNLPKPYNKYSVKIVSNGLAIDEYVPQEDYKPKRKGAQWGDIDYTGTPWVSNVSRPDEPSLGLDGRHLSLWASHGYYYDVANAVWKWQRPGLFCTNEDMFTQTIVVPYLIPMLERAGAIVFTPRERDYQTREIIIDNAAGARGGYIEVSSGGNRWEDTAERGFALHTGAYRDGENPFAAGTARKTAATSRQRSAIEAVYQPNFPETGSYAVYVSYQSLPNSVDDALYTVYHRGQQTTFRVNQRMGGGTWVYLGTFSFDKGCDEFNRVVVSNLSDTKGVVTTDAVRFGGGMGNIRRGDRTSGLPRCLEGARYTAQWYGAPYSVYSTRKGSDDYADDINVRSLMTNWLAGGSPYVPAREGKGVPIELCLAVHSDAGYTARRDSTIGTLTICTTDYNDGRLGSGVTRMMSSDFAEALLAGVKRDIAHEYGRWSVRRTLDRNYSETRLPEVPSAIIETLSHQNFNDMRFGHDPNFKFTLARSIYKTILRFVTAQHGRAAVVQPLTPDHFRVEIIGRNRVRLSWTAVSDKLEPTATPTAYKVYTAAGRSDYDNGVLTKRTSMEMDVEPGVVYNFRVSAVNRGGESLPTASLSAYYTAAATQTVLVVDAFRRLSAPATVDDGTAQGFRLDEDMGVQRGLFCGWGGAQQCFDKSRGGRDGVNGLGYSGYEMAGTFVMGNEFNYVETHAAAIAAAGRYNIAACSRECIENGDVALAPYSAVDVLFGLEQDDGHSLRTYKTFTPAMQTALTRYTAGGGRLLVSGAYIGRDMQRYAERTFLASVLKTEYAGPDSIAGDTVIGLATEFVVYRKPNAKHYAATSTDVLRPLGNAFCVMQYEGGRSAATAYDGPDYKTFVMGFPFECIVDPRQRSRIMAGILDFLTK